LERHFAGLLALFPRNMSEWTENYAKEVGNPFFGLSKGRSERMVPGFGLKEKISDLGWKTRKQ